MALALYRKYRPKFLKDLLGQELVVEIIQNAAKQDKLAQAYLFYGPRGSGKTTIARLIAKLANCETRAAKSEFRAKGEPCNKCRVCEDIDEGRGMDVHEIDAASNRGIDEIRSLKEGIRIAPIAYRYKVFIIDEAHMLTGPAFNALLKTLEEPPVHAIFVLATTEYEKIPATILSRTQRFPLAKVGKAQIVEKLKMICGEEHIKADDEALELVAVVADGSVRDAESLLGQLSHYKKIDGDTARDGLGRMGRRKMQELTALIVKKDLASCLKYISELDDSGVNLVQFTKDLIHYLRRILSLKMSPALETLFENDLTKDEIQAIREMGAASEANFLIALIKTLIRAWSEMRYSPFAIVPLEVAVIESLQPKN